MRWLTILFLLVVTALVTVPAQGQQAMAGGVHDVRADKSLGGPCDACHAASPAGAGGAVRWSRTLHSGYQVYDASVNPDFKGGSVSLAGGGQESLLCLSCHDGTTAGNVDASAARGSASPGMDLRRDHPVGFSYTASQMANPRGLAVAPVSALKLFGPSRRLECPTCHDVHAGVGPSLLRIANDNSRLCLGCHV